ncbi:MAG TPA: hypothetical protein VIN40_09080 [Candidatus Tyrphobacter sp.]
MRRLCIAFLVILGLLCTAATPTGCRMHPGLQVVLYGVGDDPGVFLWDSRFRLRAYHAASFDEAQALLPHALLVGGGTRAVVLSCFTNFVQPKYRLFPDNAVDVRVLTGSLRGRTGWVLGGDARTMH